jgi:hypothetical protein
MIVYVTQRIDIEGHINLNGGTKGIQAKKEKTGRNTIEAGWLPLWVISGLGQPTCPTLTLTSSHSLASIHIPVAGTVIR